MTAHNTRTVSFWLTTGAGSTSSVTAVTQGSPTGFTSTITGTPATGDVIVMSGTGWKSADTCGILSDYTGGSGKMLGSNSTYETTAASTPASLLHFDDDELTLLCPSEITDNANTPSTVSVGTFCQPEAVIANPVVEAGTISISGYVDICDESYQALYECYEAKDQRYLRIDLGNAGGWLVVPVTCLSMSWSVPLEGAVGWTIEFAKGSATKHAFDASTCP